MYPGTTKKLNWHLWIGPVRNSPTTTQKTPASA